MYLKHYFHSWAYQVADMEMYALNHHGLEIYIYDCCRLPLGNMPKRILVVAGLISSIIVVVPIWNLPTLLLWWYLFVTWRYILDGHKIVFLRAVWVKNTRLQINDKLGIIFIIKGPLGRQNRTSIHPPLESFNHSSRSPSFVGLKIFTLGTKYLYSSIKAISCARWSK